MRLLFVFFCVLSLVMCGSGTKDKVGKPTSEKVAEQTTEQASPQVPDQSPEPTLLVISKQVDFSGPIDASELGLRKEDVLIETGRVAPFRPLGGTPGENQKYDGVYGAPPMIPHSVDYFLPIKAGLNDCLICHTKPSKSWLMKGVPILSDFHRMDREGKRVRDERGIYMGFYNCSTCHNVMTDARPLVENTYAPK